MHVCLVAQWCLTLCDPMDCRSPPGSGIEPASPVSLSLQADSLPTEPSGKPKETLVYNQNQSRHHLFLKCYLKHTNIFCGQFYPISFTPEHSNK